jgi:hypothetical protein
MLEMSRLFYKIGFLENHKPRPNKGLYVLPNICDSYTWTSAFLGQKIGKILDFFWGHVHNGLHASELLVHVHTPSELCPFCRCD